MTAADGDRSGQSGHLHLFVDRPPTPADQPIPKEDGIIHTTDSRLSLPGLAPGNGVHTPLQPPARAKASFIVTPG